ncbi:MAG: NYN domain-containing protein [bacterium]
MITVIIDGYNFIFNSYFKISVKSEKLQELRNNAIILLSRYYNVKKNKVIVVFDGYLTQEPAESKYNIENIEVIYSKRGEKADAVIMRIAEKIRNSLVVTNDNEIKRYVDRLDNVSSISPEDFKLIVNNIINEEGESGKYLNDYDFTDDEDDDFYNESKHSSTKKKGNPHRLSKKERLKMRKIKKL